MRETAAPNVVAMIDRCAIRVFSVSVFACLCVCVCVCVITVCVSSFFVVNLSFNCIAQLRMSSTSSPHLPPPSSANETTRWLSTLILSDDQPLQRAKTIEYWIAVAQVRSCVSYVVCQVLYVAYRLCKVCRLCAVCSVSCRLLTNLPGGEGDE